MIDGFWKPIGRRSCSWLAAMVVMLVLLLTGCGNVIGDHSTETSQSQNKSHAPLTSFKDVSDYIRTHHKLPDNFITKKEAEQLGWVPAKGNLHQVAPGKSIGGDRFGNREGLLPKAKNRIWYEADINYKKGPRGPDRIIYSNDGLIYMTTDHYKSFADITKEGSVPE